MLTTQLFDLLLDFGPQWQVSDVETNIHKMTVDITIGGYNDRLCPKEWY